MNEQTFWLLFAGIGLAASATYVGKALADLIRGK